MGENAMFVFEKSEMNTLDKSLVYHSIAVLHLVAPLKTTVSRKMFNLCPDVA